MSKRRERFCNNWEVSTRSFLKQKNVQKVSRKIRKNLKSMKLVLCKFFMYYKEHDSSSLNGSCVFHLRTEPCGLQMKTASAIEGRCTTCLHLSSISSLIHALYICLFVVTFTSVVKCTLSSFS